MLNKKKIAGAVLSFGILASGGVLGGPTALAAPKGYELELFEGKFEKQFEKELTRTYGVGEKIPAYVKGIPGPNSPRVYDGNGPRAGAAYVANSIFQLTMISIQLGRLKGYEHLSSTSGADRKELSFKGLEDITKIVEENFDGAQKTDLMKKIQDYHVNCEKDAQLMVEQWSHENIKNYLSYAKSRNLLDKQIVAQVYETGRYYADDVPRSTRMRLSERMTVEMGVVLRGHFQDLLERKWEGK